jgi:NADPH:quinone reductase-like Zn-dependent oxidoreductase
MSTTTRHVHFNFPTSCVPSVNLPEHLLLADASGGKTRALVLTSRSGPYTLVHGWEKHKPLHGEVLVQTHSIGLNPVDWKCVAFGFGIHSLPWVSGRECSGTVVDIGPGVSNFKIGDRVLAVSTDYRDNRTSTFQEASTRPKQ